MDQELIQQFHTLGYDFSRPATPPVTWEEIFQRLVELIHQRSREPREFSPEHLAYALDCASKALENEGWRDAIDEGLNLGLDAVADGNFPDPDIEPDEGPLTEQYENAERLGDDNWLEAAYEDRVSGFWED